MSNRKIIRSLVIGALAAIAIGTGTVLYVFNKPHRDVQAAAVDLSTTSRDLVEEYLASPEKANEKYLSDDGNSKVLVIKGKVHSISRDLNNQVVLLLKAADDKVGVSCTFTVLSNSRVANIPVGADVVVKGVIRSGAGYDKDLELYEDVIVEKCDLIN